MNAAEKIVTRNVAYEHGGVKLNGYLAYGDGGGGALRPGVLVAPEWWGLLDYPKQRAEHLARLGYVAFAIEMYGGEKTTRDPKQARAWASEFYGKPLMAERARAGLDQLLAVKGVAPEKVAAIGYCFGGSVVQSLAFSGAPLAGVVSFHGGLIPPSAEAAARTKAKLLICHGGLDYFETPEEVAAFKRALDEGKLDYQLNIYSGAVHAFTNPDADKLAREAGIEGIAYNETADRRSWMAMKVFFEEIFSAPK
ncbi:dienelactone hydrolase family protein [Horticoccus luteus]|uniref:Dienelactone hydrolase family protein n=1 Tax=Horticoccus luteus TaxID=2862869 RepID=A0A8F9XGQ5_9BACT|nr:dienelactone hydrolase family protein [Horticoccus luteus]QYM78490.1 dienelactone hydrolase family protein [Horticoccus luteus]